MSITSEILQLTPKQVHEMYNHILEACLIFETGGDGTAVFKRLIKRKVGRQRRLYKLLASYNENNLNTLSRSISEYKVEKFIRSGND